MSFKTNRAITLSDGDEDKFPRQLAPVVLPGGKQPGGGESSRSPGTAGG